jgi:peptide/nickel transport system substrate-binding protein
VNEKIEKEFRLRRGDHILNYISKFSSTEKAIFGILVICAVISAVILTVDATTLFTTRIPTIGGSITEGEIGLPRAVNPVLALSDVDRDITTLVYSGLTKYQNNILVPDLAQSWTISSDGLTYDFILKNNLFFQDNKPLTADDIAFTVQKIQDPALKSPRQADWVNVSVKVISPTKIQFILKQPSSGFLTHTTVGIIPKHIWSSVSNNQFIFSQYNIEPVGSGIYKLAGIVRDSGGIPHVYNLTSWKGYYGTMPFIPSISFSFFTNQDKAVQALTSGLIDSLASIDPQVAAKLARRHYPLATHLRCFLQPESGTCVV